MRQPRPGTHCPIGRERRLEVLLGSVPITEDAGERPQVTPGGTVTDGRNARRDGQVPIRYQQPGKLLSTRLVLEGDANLGQISKRRAVLGAAREGELDGGKRQRLNSSKQTEIRKPS